MALLGLTDSGLRSVVLLPLCYRDPAGEWLLPMGKVRKFQANTVTEMSSIPHDALSPTLTEFMKSCHFLES